MKKLIYFAAAAALLGMASCGQGSKTENGLDSLYSQEKVDSLFFLVAETQGMARASETKMDSTFNKELYLKGFYYGFNADTTSTYFMGVQEGLQCSGWLNYYVGKGININRKQFIKEYVKGFVSDSINDEQMQKAQFDIQARYQELQEALAAYEEAKLEASEVSQNNINAGIAYIDSIAKKDAAVKVYASGIAVKVDSIGEGEVIGDTERIFITGAMRTPDGRTLEMYDNRMIFVGAQPQGFAEALQKMKVGEKATVYVPGKLAFGVKRNRFNLTPNQMVIYDIKVDGIYNPQPQE